ncbi:MAG: hypothetical protein OXN89_27485 [Bryobacterales bacterium]|nr:hypothetical protein [Bryobacterales bacterium]
MTLGREDHGVALQAAGPVIAGLLVLSTLSVRAMAGGDGWTRIERLPAGVQTRVCLYTADLTSGRKCVKGRLRWTDSYSITLRIPSGEARTLEQDRIRKVEVRRPVARRYIGWVGLGLTVAVTWLYSANNSKPPYPLFYGPGSGLAAIAFWRNRWRTIYRARRGNRS